MGYAEHAIGSLDTGVEKVEQKKSKPVEVILTDEEKAELEDE